MAKPMFRTNTRRPTIFGTDVERAVASALRVTVEAVQHQVNQIIAREIANANKKLADAEIQTPVPIAA